MLAAAFFEWMRVKNYSERTVEDRQHYLALLRRCGASERGITQPAEVTKAILERYQRWLYHYRKENGQPLTFGSQFAHLVPVRAFFKWCARRTTPSTTRPANSTCPRWRNACPSTC